MASLTRFIALWLAAVVLLLACGLLLAVDQPDAAIVVGAVALFGLVGGVLVAAGSIPHERIRSADENARLGLVQVIGNGLIVLVGVPLWGLTGQFIPGTIFVVASAAMATMGVGTLNAARLLRLVPTLIAPDEEPRAVALGANAMPGRRRSLVVATDDRIVWAEGRRLRDRHAVRLEDVESFDADRRTGTLTVAGGGEVLRVRPVPRQELEKFERLLAS